MKTYPFWVIWFAVIVLSDEILRIQADDGDAKDKLQEADKAPDNCAYCGAGAVALSDTVEDESFDTHGYDTDCLVRFVIVLLVVSLRNLLILMDIYAVRLCSCGRCWVCQERGGRAKKKERA